MQRFLSAAEPLSHEQADIGFKLTFHTKKLQASQIQNKQDLSNLSKDRQVISSLWKEEIKTLIAGYMHDFEEDFRSVKGMVESQRRNGVQLARELDLLKSNIVNDAQNPFIRLQGGIKRVPSTGPNTPLDTKKYNIESETISNPAKLQQINKTNKSQNVEKLRQQISRDISLMHNQLKLEIASIRDSVIDIEEVFRSKCQKLEAENSNLLNVFQQSIDDLTSKYRHSSQQMEKVFTELDKYGANIETNCSKIEKIEKAVKQIDTDFENKVQINRRVFEVRLQQAQELFQSSLEKVIVPYNSNFEEMDRNISELKDIVKEVLKFTKTLGDKLAVKLNNTIDAATFQKTIENINQSFNETYLLNTQKIRQLNEKEYEVYNELNQVKNVLEDLKVEYKSSKKVFDGEETFDKRITSLGDLGIDSDQGEFTQEETLEPHTPNPFRRKTSRELEASIDY